MFEQYAKSLAARFVTAEYSPHLPAVSSGSLTTRQRFLMGLEHQIQFALDPEYRYRNSKNKQVAPKAWWVEDNGICQIQPRYGNTKLDKERSIHCNRNELLDILKQLKDDAIEGRLDEILEAIAQKDKRSNGPSHHHHSAHDQQS